MNSNLWLVYARKKAPLSFELKILYFFRQRNYFWQKVDTKFQQLLPVLSPSHNVNRKNFPRNAQILCLNLRHPIFEHRLCVQLCSETIAICFQFLTFNMRLPAFSKDIFHSTQIQTQFTFNLKFKKKTSVWIKKYLQHIRLTCFAQTIEPDTGGTSRPSLISFALLAAYWVFK